MALPLSHPSPSLHMCPLSVYKQSAHAWCRHRRAGPTAGVLSRLRARMTAVDDEDELWEAYHNLGSDSPMRSSLRNSMTSRARAADTTAVPSRA